MAHNALFGTIIQNGAYGAPFMVAGSSEQGCYLKIEWVPVPVPGVPSSDGAQVRWTPRRALNGSPLNSNGADNASRIEVRLRGKVKTTCVCIDKKEANPGGNILPLERQGHSHGSGLGNNVSTGGIQYTGIVAFKYNPANGHCPPGPDGKCKGGPMFKDINFTKTYGPSDFVGAGGRCSAGAAGCTEDSWRNLQNKEKYNKSDKTRVYQDQSYELHLQGDAWELARASLGKAMLDALRDGTTQIDCNLGIEQPEAI